ncbi:RRQRL motif-containing zinc-binding protein [Phytomonospora endophytica]|nr:RRQRL motif-containing zinc-binding protein [Phytomonospora endophytica]
MPTYPYRMAPTGLATRRQLAALKLTPGTSEPAAQLVWRRGERKAYLFHIDRAKPKREATPAQLAALGRAMKVRRTCDMCGTEQPYCVSRKYEACNPCIDTWMAVA